ncbi:hypothetical protein AAFF_G00154720 [Aldrovandia affinis]|uniref:Uncharacterized protein n=1 Tax=Aldrovandia affinis TaxID=143900 RepID=A0AAD7SZW5_9TELE|nr:hypothetical protein AAFF_G00154720 [Aldrovandia affinis]
MLFGVAVHVLALPQQHHRTAFEMQFSCRLFKTNMAMKRQLKQEAITVFRFNSGLKKHCYMNGKATDFDIEQTPQSLRLDESRHAVSFYMLHTF